MNHGSTARAFSLLLFCAQPLCAAAAPPADHGDLAARRGAMPIEGTITNPDWISKPSGEDMARFYPAIPQLLGIPGRALISCTVSALGMLGACQLISETPAGVGFGAAAINMAPLFHMRPKTLDGALVAGAQVNIPMHFLLEATQTPSQAAAPAGLPPSENARAVARRLLAEAGEAGPLRDNSDRFIKYVKAFVANRGAGQPDTQQSKAAFDAFRAAYSLAYPKIMDRAADTFARAMTEAQLMEVARFMDSPAGQALEKAKSAVQAQIEAISANWNDDVQTDAAQRFCRVVTCLDSPPSPAAAQPASAEPKAIRHQGRNP